MEASHSNPLRVVIQQLGVSPAPSYRIIVYGDEESPHHSDFSSAELLLERLRAAITDFDVSQLCLNPLEQGQGSIVFVGELKLARTQLSVLGLI